MRLNCNVPSRYEAELLIANGHNKNPGPWVNHCKITARAAETIAKNCGMDVEMAYIAGLLHDIGYTGFRDFKGRTGHIVIGYEDMLEKGFGAIARICLSHSFPYKDIGAYGGRDTNWSDAEKAMICQFLVETDFDDYDKLIQLCDALATPQSICLIDKRMMDVVRRHGFSDYTVKKWNATFELKDYFDAKCSANIYNFFAEEIVHDILG